jgi:voltage-gated potassium channel
MSIVNVICGFGSVGQAAAKAMLSQRDPQDIMVVDRDISRLEHARLREFKTVFGDASVARTLRIAQVGVARDILACVGGPDGAKVVSTAPEIAPTAYIRAATPTPEFQEALLVARANDVLVVSDVAGVMLARSLHS